MRTLFSTLTLVVIAAALGGCAAHPPGEEITFLRQDLTRLKNGQQELSDQLSRTRDNLLLVEGRMKDQQDVIEKLRARMSAQEAVASRVALPRAAGPSAAAQHSYGSIPAPTDIYLQAFSDYASARFPEAIAGFESFLKYYPANPYAGNAQYWLAECHYSRQDYERAIEEFGKVVGLYPQGSKAPEALLKTASALLKTGQKQLAIEKVRSLLERYPDSTAAQKTLKDSRFLEVPHTDRGLNDRP